MKAVITKQDIPGLIIMIIIGLGLTFLGYTKIRKAAESKNWPVTNGVVTSSEISGGIKLYPSINYTYTVNDTVYNSGKISNIGFSSKNRSVVEEIIKKYSPGSEINVYYNDSKPSEALLEPGINTGNILLLAFGIIMIAIPVMLSVFMKFDLKKTQNI